MFIFAGSVTDWALETRHQRAPFCRDGITDRTRVGHETDRKRDS